MFGATVHVMDDGFQHWSLARDIDLVIVTDEDLDGRRLPFGRLRSPVRALSRVDAVIVDGELPKSLPRLRRVVGARTQLFELRRAHGRPWWLEGHSSPPAPPERVVAMAGIARPERFSESLEAAGWRVERLMGFADHHRYGPRDLERVARACQETSVGVVLTTEKDAMRLLPLRPLPFAVAAVPLEAAIEPASQFRELLLGRLREVRACG
jgi:tetraacyldisaccharide 4'-kinase